MDVTQPIEVITDGTTAHRPASLWQFKDHPSGRKELRERIFVGWYPACQPKPETTLGIRPWQPVSAPWAIHQGATVCPDCEAS